jgi:cell division protein FtsN
VTAPVTPSVLPPAAAAGDARYEITAASFKTEERAASVAAQLGRIGLPVTSRLDSTGTWYRVVVGPFPSMDAARAAQEQLEERGFSGTRIYSP